MSQRKVKIVKYDPKWAKLFKDEEVKILAAIAHLKVIVEHVGSTAVPGLGAKPTIDIMVGVPSLSDSQKCIEPLSNIGYQYQPQHEVSMPERRFFRKGEPPKEQHYHLHMVEIGSEFWKTHLTFRDYLKTHPETAKRYYELKKKLASKYSLEPEAYTEAKTSFIESTVAKALKRPE